jgi:hypothetical protein
MSWSHLRLGACTRRISAVLIGTKATSLATDQVVSAAWCMPFPTDTPTPHQASRGGDRRSARNRPSVAEQSHKDEMSEAVRGDFERLRARRERSNRAGQRLPPSRPERVVLTRPPEVVDAGADPPQPPGHDEEETPAKSSRSWLRSRLRRG